MAGGWVKIGRSIMDDSLWENHDLVRMWLWCKLKASHSAVKFRVGYKEVCLEPGQVFFGTVKGPKDAGLSRQTFRTCAKKLLEEGHLVKVREITNCGTIYLFVDKYIYNDEEDSGNQQSTIHQPTSNQPLTTNKNDQEISPSPAHARIGEHGEGGSAEPPPYEPPDIPEDFLTVAREVYGLTPEPIIVAWLITDKYPMDWIKKATTRTAEKIAEKRIKKSSAPSYASGILRDWERNGGPEDDSPQRAYDGKNSARRPPDKPRPPAGSRVREMAIAQGMNPDAV